MRTLIRFLARPAGGTVETRDRIVDGDAFTFELETTADTRSGVVDRPRLSLHELGMYKRRWAWGMFVALLCLGLLLPLSGAARKDGSETLRSLHLPSGLPGPLHASHALLNERCEACHEKPFVRERSEACLTCHATNLHTHLPATAHVPVSVEREHIYVQQPPISSSGYSSQAMNPHYPHTERKTETKTCSDCHLAKSGDNNAIVAQTRRSRQLDNAPTSHPGTRHASCCRRRSRSIRLATKAT